MKLIKEILKDDRIQPNYIVGLDGAKFHVRLDHRLYDVIASNGGGWDHVSINPYRHSRMPNWNVMCELKDLCFYDDETVIEYHPKKSDYVNVADKCLHLWRPQKQEIPVPPKAFV